MYIYELNLPRCKVILGHIELQKFYDVLKAEAVEKVKCRTNDDKFHLALACLVYFLGIVKRIEL